MLRADVMLPADRKPAQRHPVILSIGPYFGRNELNSGLFSSGPVLRFNDLLTEGRVFERGYAYVQVDSRGYGGSGGCNDFGGHGEQMDTAAAVHWAASQSWSTGKVGMWGKSYDAWTQVMALAENPAPLKAAVIQAPLIEAYRALFLNGVHYGSGWYLTPSLYTEYDLAPVTASDAEPEEFLYPAAGTATNPDCYAENTVMTTQPDRSLPHWQERDIVSRAARSTVPVLWSHGFNDSNTKPDNFLPVFKHLSGPKRAWIGQWDHVRGNEVRFVGRDGFMTEAMEWFDRFLKGEQTPTRPGIRIQDGQGTWRTEATWPPADTRRTRFALAPGSYTEGVVNPPILGAPAHAWSITTKAPHDAHLAGVVRVRVEYEATVPLSNVIAELYDVAPGGNARLMSRGAMRLPDLSGAVTFRMYPQDWRIAKGHRLGLRLRSKGDWFYPTPTAGQVHVTGGHLKVPFLRTRRGIGPVGGPASAMTSVPETSVPKASITGDRATGAWPRALRD
jgi:hypothetical protein